MLVSWLLNYCGVVLRREDVPELIVLLKELKTSSKHGKITAGKSERKLVYSGLAFAYKIVKVLGHPSFYDETMGRPPPQRAADRPAKRTGRDRRIWCCGFTGWVNRRTDTAKMAGWFWRVGARLLMMKRIFVEAVYTVSTHIWRINSKNFNHFYVFNLFLIY